MDIVKELPKMDMNNSGTGCCPVFDPEPWDRKLFELSDLQMVKASTKSLFYVPLNMGKVMEQTMNSIRNNDGEVKDRYLILSEDVSPFRCEHHFLVNKPINGLENEILSGRFYTMVFNGGYNQVPKWIEKLKGEMEGKNLILNRVYAFYTTCPKCAKEYGNNYIVLFGESVN